MKDEAQTVFNGTDHKDSKEAQLGITPKAICHKVGLYGISEQMFYNWGS